MSEDKKFHTFPVLFILMLVGLCLIYFFIIPADLINTEISRESVSRMSSHEEPDISEVKNIEQERLSVTIPSEEEFSPLDSGVFIVTFYFSQEFPPVLNRRQKLVAHYEPDKSPYTGWAIAFRRFPASYRFEFYIKDRNGSGGWFSFDTMEVQKDSWYSVTFVVKSDEYLFSLMTPLDKNLQPRARTQKLGGFPLNGIRDIRTQSRLQITSGKPGIGPFRGSVSGLTILQLDEIPKEKVFMTHAGEGPHTLLKQYRDRCIVSLYESENTSSCKYKFP